MPINFIPNDPAAGTGAPPMRQKNPRRDRPASRSSFTFNGSSPEDIFAPGTPEFLFWQCREAALAALEAFEACAGNHTRWQGNRRKLLLGQDEGVVGNKKVLERIRFQCRCLACSLVVR
jgi:hypothetical protein